MEPSYPLLALCPAGTYDVAVVERKHPPPVHPAFTYGQGERPIWAAQRA
jgi:hypothetical protein